MGWLLLVVIMVVAARYGWKNREKIDLTRREAIGVAVFVSFVLAAGIIGEIEQSAGSSNGSTPTSTTRQPTPATTLSDADVREDIFELIVAEYFGSADLALLADTTAFGKAACNDLDAGWSMADLFADITLGAYQPGATEPQLADLGYVLSLSVSAFCPEYEPALDRFLDTLP